MHSDDQNFQPTLDEIGLKFGTDKSSIHHNYLSFYSEYFDFIRNKSLKILEIGVFNGASLATWESYFTNAQIIGADIDPKVRKFARNRIHIEVMDQSNLQDLANIATLHGPFDIIIDDGSHIWDHQICSFRSLFPFLRDGGYYIIEDLQTNYGEMAAQYRGTAQTSCMHFLKLLADRVVEGSSGNLSVEEDPFIRTFVPRIRQIVFSRHVCLIEKMSLRKRSSLHKFINTSPSLLQNAVNGFDLHIDAHIGNIGDITSETGGIACLRSADAIQGFILRGTPGLSTPPSLSYRARLSSGEWTPWAPTGTFVGTSGKRQNLTGLAVRLEGSWNSTHELRVAGVFGTDPQVVEVGSGLDCISPSVPGDLRGLQVQLIPIRATSDEPSGGS